MKTRTTPLLMASMLAMLILCGCQKEPQIVLRSVDAVPSRLNLAIGDTQQIRLDPVPREASLDGLSITWKSANEAVATVSGGLVRAKSAGSTEVRVQIQGYPALDKRIPVTVYNPVVPLQDIVVSPESVAVEVGEMKKLTVSPVPANAAGFALQWSSENREIATVNINGGVSGRRVGKTVVTVKAGSIEKKIPVSVIEYFKITVNGMTHVADTMNYEQVSEGVAWFKFRLPEFVNGFGTLGKGLVVNTLSVDLTVGGNRVELCPASQATWGNIERPSVMYVRKEKEYAATGYKPVAAVNGDFYLLSTSNNTGYAFINNRPVGMEVGNGMLVQTPFTENGPGIGSGFMIHDNGRPGYSEFLSFSGQVEAGGETCRLYEVNGFAPAGELVLFNPLSNSWPTDSAYAWSPYPSTMVSLTRPVGGWRLNERMECTVTGIDTGVETVIPPAAPFKGKDFNGQGAILVGNKKSPESTNDAGSFLGKLAVGEKVGITMRVKAGGTLVPDKHLNVVGFRGVILKGGTIYNTWNEAHPRTAVGYSQDRKKVFMVVLDGRQKDYSVGATTGQLAAILKAMGASEGVNLDGGGSSCMVVNGEVKNITSDSSERAVANALIVFAKR